MASRLVFPGKQQVELEQFTPGEVTAGKVAVRTLYSLMSTGTENIAFNQLFAPGTHWANYVKYPFHPGYVAVGEVAEVGADVTTVKVGDRVGIRQPHASWYVTSESECFAIPQTVDPRDATWFSLAKIAYQGAFRAGYKLGESVVIVGAGPIGQMSIRWALADGVSPVIVIDPVEKRLEFARRAGQIHGLAMGVDDAREEVARLTEGKLANVVIDSTGHHKVFASALSLVADQGRIVILGDTGTPSEQHLTGDVINRSLTILGAHARYNWATHEDAILFAQLVDSGRFDISGLNTHTFRPEECAKAYETANTMRGETMGIIFDWTKS